LLLNETILGDERSSQGLAIERVTRKQAQHPLIVKARSRLAMQLAVL